MRGELIQPGHESYDANREVYNAMIGKRPALIARCADVADVIAAVDFGCENDLLVAIRGGGHNGAGLGICDDGLVIDLSPMKGIRVDPASRTVRVEGGATWGDVDHAAHAFGLAVPSGVISTTGVGGLTLGGGLGHLTRKCGLTIDNLLEADVVLADGSFVTASEHENEDLFWAIRGGGGNFGVVTSFLLRLHPVSTIVGGPTLWGAGSGARSHALVPGLYNKRPRRPERLLRFPDRTARPAFPGTPAHEEDVRHRLVLCRTGRKGRRGIRSRSGGRPSGAARRSRHALSALQSAFDALYPAGLQWYWKADFINELSDEAIEKHMKYAEVPTLHSTMHLYPINGAAHRVGKNDTAWSYREATWGMVIAGVTPTRPTGNSSPTGRGTTGRRSHRHSAGGAYVNMMMDEGQDRVRDSYRDNYDRLSATKREYDPNNLFRVNQNIEPGG